MPRRLCVFVGRDGFPGAGPAYTSLAEFRV
jgi:hypothetical protein